MKTILLTNDDSFTSQGITRLRDRLKDQFKIVLVAPDREKSAVSMSLTLNQPLRISEIGEDIYTVSGTPADCINVGIRKILAEKPDFIISGMNLGENLSEDVFFSGTLAGAFTGYLYGIPSLAVSLIANPDNQREEEYDFTGGADCTSLVLSKLITLPGNDFVCNLNIPFHSNGKIWITRTGKKRYQPDIIEKMDPRGKKYFWIGTGQPVYEGEKGTDIWAIQQGYVSLGVLKYDLNSESGRKKIGALFD